MKKLLTLSLVCAFAFSSALFAGEVHVEDCGAYAESNSRFDGKTLQDSTDSSTEVKVQSTRQ